MSDTPTRTRFFELQGPEALPRLRRLAGALRRDGARVSLLASRDQPELYLLVSESDGEAAAGAAPPEGCRVWTFEPVRA